jgi:hypothetical protein
VSTSSWRAKPDKAHKVLQGFSPSPRRDIQVAVDLENLGIEVHVEAIYRHNVGRVLLTFTRIELAAHESKPLPVPNTF